MRHREPDEMVDAVLQKKPSHEARAVGQPTAPAVKVHDELGRQLDPILDSSAEAAAVCMLVGHGVPPFLALVVFAGYCRDPTSDLDPSRWRSNRATVESFCKFRRSPFVAPNSSSAWMALRFVRTPSWSSALQFFPTPAAQESNIARASVVTYRTRGRASRRYS